MGFIGQVGISHILEMCITAFEYIKLKRKLGIIHNDRREGKGCFMT